MTNGDKFFRNATDEQIARFLTAVQSEILEKVSKAIGYPGTPVKYSDITATQSAWLDWVKQEVEE